MANRPLSVDEVVFVAINGEETPRVCYSCESLEIYSNGCKSCGRLFCPVHSSQLDSSFCSSCIDFTNTRIESKPLTDSDGVTHKGRQLILTGETWMRNRDVISRMTDIELEAKLTALKQAVREAEMILDFRRISMNQVESEKGDRYSRKVGRRRLIGAMDSVHKSSTKIPGSGAEKVEVAKDTIKALKGLGLNQTAIANILLKLAQGVKKP
jgi:hypothetical protein